ncbi:MAG: phytanoyl-CoA dioxygenase family protein, partial [Pseudomonadota bacterium]|nr:phytanoyl-CoA dioxygenase family protein [Pseudomonadota bacterium]
MTPEEILSCPAKILSPRDREQYFEHGYVGAPAMVSGEWLERLQTCAQRYVDESRNVDETDKRFDLEPDHTAEEPRIRRLNSPVDVDDLFWEFASTGPFVDVAEDLLGPNIKFHHSKLNYKWSGGGEEVKWHQDIQFWPHTNYDVLTVGVYLDDVASDM